MKPWWNWRNELIVNKNIVQEFIPIIQERCVWRSIVHTRMCTSEAMVIHFIVKTGAKFADFRNPRILMQISEIHRF